jgi:hypothetical protein
MAKRKVITQIETEVDEEATFGAKADKVHDKGDFAGQPADGNSVSVLPGKDEVMKRLEARCASGNPKDEAEARDMLVIARAAFGVK